MTRRPVDDYIDEAQKALERLRVAMHESITAAQSHQEATEVLTEEVHKQQEDR